MDGGAIVLTRRNVPPLVPTLDSQTSSFFGITGNDFLVQSVALRSAGPRVQGTSVALSAAQRQFNVFSYHKSLLWISL